MSAIKYSHQDDMDAILSNEEASIAWICASLPPLMAASKRDGAIVRHCRMGQTVGFELGNHFGARFDALGHQRAGISVSCINLAATLGIAQLLHDFSAGLAGYKAGITRVRISACRARHGGRNSDTRHVNGCRHATEGSRCENSRDGKFRSVHDKSPGWLGHLVCWFVLHRHRCIDEEQCSQPVLTAA